MCEHFKFLWLAKSCVVPNNQKCSSNYQLSFEGGKRVAGGSCHPVAALLSICLPPQHHQKKPTTTTKPTSDENQSSSTSFAQRKKPKETGNVNKHDAFFFHIQRFAFFFLSSFCALKIIFIMLIHITPSNAFLSLSHGTRDIIFNVHVLDFVWVAIAAAFLLLSFSVHTFFCITLKIWYRSNVASTTKTFFPSPYFFFFSLRRFKKKCVEVLVFHLDFIFGVGFV